MRILSALLLTALTLVTALTASESRAPEAPSISSNESHQPAAETSAPIQDNSFLVEEAYNQEDGVIQHISFVQRSSTGDWVYTQTDEWPLRSIKHQLSFTATVNQSAAFARTGPGWGDTA